MDGPHPYTGNQTAAALFFQSLLKKVNLNKEQAQGALSTASQHGTPAALLRRGKPRNSAQGIPAAGSRGYLEHPLPTQFYHHLQRSNTPCHHIMKFSALQVYQHPHCQTCLPQSHQPSQPDNCRGSINSKHPLNTQTHTPFHSQ